MHHPDNDEAVFIRSSKLLVLIIPLNDNNVALVTLQMLVHREVTAALALTGL